MRDANGRTTPAVILRGGPRARHAFFADEWAARVAAAADDTEKAFTNSAWPTGYRQTKDTKRLATGHTATVWAWAGAP